MISLRSFRRVRELALPDLLPYALQVDEGVLLNKDGSLTASWSYRGPDDAGMTAAGRDMVNDRLNRAFRGLGSGWCLQTNALRRRCRVYPPEAASHFPDRVSRRIDRERREHFENSGHTFETFTALTLTWMPPLTRRLEGMFLGEEGERPPPEGDVRLAEFSRAVREFEDNLSVALPCRRLRTRREDGTDYDEQLELVEECLTGRHRKVRLPDCGMFTDSHVGQYPLVTGTMPKVGDRYVAVVHIAGFPPATRAGLLNPLLEMGIDFRWSTRFILLDPWEARREIRTYTRKWSQQVLGLLTPLSGRAGTGVNRHALEMKQDGETAGAAAEAGEVRFGYFTGNIVLMHEDAERLLSMAHEVRKAILSLGFGARIEDINAMEAWAGSLPAVSWANVRRPLLHSLNCADLCPTASVWAGRAHCPSGRFPRGAPPLAVLITGGSTPFRLNLHVSDVGHTLIFGPTGSGKSTLLAFLAAQMLRYRRVRLFAFDKGHSLYAINQACGGAHYQVGVDRLSLAPLSRLRGSPPELEWCVHWIETLCRLSDHAPDNGEREEIRRALVAHGEGNHPSLRDFIVQVQSREIKAALEPFACLSIYNGRSDSLDREGPPFTCFEIGELLSLPGEKCLPILLYLFHRIEGGLDGAPAFIIIDEAWTVLGHPVFRDKLTEWLRVLRKANAAVVLATQSLSDAGRSGILDVLQEACPTRIFLPNPSALLEESSRHYRAMGLGRAQCRIVAEARPRRDYYVTSPEGDRLVELGLGPVARAFCAAGGPRDLREIRAEQQRSGSDWPREWLRRRTGMVLGLALALMPVWADGPLGPAASGRVEEVEEGGGWFLRADIPDFRRPGPGNPAYWEIPEGGVIHRDLLWDERRLCREAGIPFRIDGWGENHLALGHARDPATLIDARPVESTPAGRKYDDPWRAVTLHDQTLCGKLWALLRHQPGHRALLGDLHLEERGGRILPRTLSPAPVRAPRIPGAPFDGEGFTHLALSPGDRRALLQARDQGMVLEFDDRGGWTTVRRTAHIRRSAHEPVRLFLVLQQLQAARPVRHRWRHDQLSELNRAIADLPLVPNRDHEAVAAGLEESHVEVTAADYWEAVLRLGDRIAVLHRGGELERVAFSGPGGSQIRTTDFLTWLVSLPVRPAEETGPDPAEVARRGRDADPASFLDWFERAMAPPARDIEADAIRRMAEGLAAGRGSVPLGTMAVQAVMSVLMADYLGALFAFFGGRMTETTQARNEAHWIAGEVTERGLARQGGRNLEAMAMLRGLGELAMRPPAPAPRLPILPAPRPGAGGTPTERRLRLLEGRGRWQREAARRLQARPGTGEGELLAARRAGLELRIERERVDRGAVRAEAHALRLLFEERSREAREEERLREARQDSLEAARARIRRWKEGLP